MASLLSVGHPGRELHLIDVENLLGTPSLTTGAVSVLRLTYDRIVQTDRTAQQVIGTSTDATLLDAALGWAGARPVFRHGPDGADLALLDAGAHAPELRFRRVVIASGDHIFAPYAARLQQAGMTVTVVSRRVALSRELAFAVRDVRYIPEFVVWPTPPGGAAARSAA